MGIRRIFTMTVVLLALIIISTTTAAAISCDCGDICVNESGWWRDGGALNASGAPIQAVVDNANAGETICVAAGSYTENVDIATAHLTLRGEGAGAVTVTAASSSDHVFNVTADYVNITGFTATGTKWGPNAGIYLGAADHCNISDNNCSNNYFGIYLDSSSGNTLASNTASSNIREGIGLSHSSGNTLASNNASSNIRYGIYLGVSSDNALTDNTASNNTRGIYLWRSSNNTLDGNNASSNNDDDGINLYESSNNTLDGNTVSSNSQHGIYLYSSSNNTLASNNASSNNNNGIYLESSSYNTLTSNTANSNIHHGICLAFSSNHNTLTSNTADSNNNDGIHLYSSSNNTLASNNASSNNYRGIYLYSSSNYNTYDGNTLSSNTQWDIYIQSSDSTFANNTLNGTTISFTYGGDVSFKGAGSPAADPAGQQTIGKFINATNQSADAWLFLNFSYSDDDVTGLDESDLKVWKHNGTMWLEDGWNGTRYLDTAGNVVGVNATSFSVFAPAAAPPPPLNCACGDICVNTSGWWRDGGALNTSTTPIQAAVNAATAGETICVAAGNYTETVYIATPHLTLRGAGAGAVTVTAASTNNNVFDVTANYVNISGFTATGATNYLCAGISLFGADNCNIYDNDCSNSPHGIRLYSSSNNTLTSNTANSNNYNGIYLYKSSNDNTLESNNASDNNFHGIELYKSNNDNTLESNNASDNNFYGISLGSSSDNTLANNTANSNRYDGIELYDSSNNTLTSNNASLNGDRGISLCNSSDNTLLNNTVKDVIRTRIRSHIDHTCALACKREVRCRDVHVLGVAPSRNTDRLARDRIIDRSLQRRSARVERAAVAPPARLVDADVTAGAAC